MLQLINSFASSLASGLVNKLIEENIISITELAIFVGSSVFGFFAYRIHIIVRNVKKIK